MKPSPTPAQSHLDRIKKLEQEVEELKTRLLIAEAKIASPQTIIIQQPAPIMPYAPQTNPFLPPYIVTC